MLLLIDSLGNFPRFVLRASLVVSLFDILVGGHWLVCDVIVLEFFSFVTFLAVDSDGLNAGC